MDMNGHLHTPAAPPPLIKPRVHTEKGGGLVTNSAWTHRKGLQSAVTAQPSHYADDTRYYEDSPLTETSCFKGIRLTSSHPVTRVIYSVISSYIFCNAGKGWRTAAAPIV